MTTGARWLVAFLEVTVKDYSPDDGRYTLNGRCFGGERRGHRSFCLWQRDSCVSRFQSTAVVSSIPTHPHVVPGEQQTSSYKILGDNIPTKFLETQQKPPYRICGKKPHAYMELRNIKHPNAGSVERTHPYILHGETYSYGICGNSILK